MSLTAPTLPILRRLKRVDLAVWEAFKRTHPDFPFEQLFHGRKVGCTLTKVNGIWKLNFDLMAILDSGYYDTNGFRVKTTEQTITYTVDNIPSLKEIITLLGLEDNYYHDTQAYELIDLLPSWLRAEYDEPNARLVIRYASTGRAGRIFTFNINDNGNESYNERYCVGHYLYDNESTATLTLLPIQKRDLTGMVNNDRTKYIDLVDGDFIVPVDSPL